MPLCSKVNSVKMVIELQFNYISMMIPVNIPDTTFKRCNKIINDFLWAGKRPQIKMSKLLPEGWDDLSFEKAKLAKHG